MQRLGQHFIRNKAVVHKVIDAIDPQKGDAIIEIGPGHGELTIPLLEKCSVVGATLSVIEKDASLAEKLQNGGDAVKNLEIIHGDALKILSTKEPSKIVGNIPYYITGHLLRTIGELEAKPVRCVFMVQKEVAERIVATPPKMNRLAASVQFWAEATIICLVPKKDFIPPPKVDSAVVALNMKPTSPDAPKNDYYRTVKAVFAQPRKTILNNLADAKIGEKNKLAAVLKKMNIDPLARPQDLSVPAIAAIARALFGDKPYSI